MAALDYFERLTQPNPVDRRQHLSERVPEHVRPELTRGLLGFVDRAVTVGAQHRALGRRILEDDSFTMPRRSTDPYDPQNEARQLRGLPVVGVKGGLGGAIKGTRPGDGIDLEALRRERRRDEHA